MQDTRTPDSGMGGGGFRDNDDTFAQPGAAGYGGTGGTGSAGTGSTGTGTGSADTSGSAHGKPNAFDELEAKIEAALEDLRPKLKTMAEGVGERVSAAKESAQPKLDQLVAGLQPRIDSLLQKMQSGLDDIRRDLEERAARARESSGESTGDASPTTPVLSAGDDETRTTSSPPLM